MCCLEYNLKAMSKKAMAELIRNLVKDKEVIAERAQSYKKQMLEYEYFANKRMYKLSNAVDELKAKYDRLLSDYEDLSERYCEVNKKYKVLKEEIIDAVEAKENTHVFEYKPGEKPHYKMSKEEEDEWAYRYLDNMLTIEAYRHNKDLMVSGQVMLEDCINNYPFVKRLCGEIISVVNLPDNRYIRVKYREYINDKPVYFTFMYNFDTRIICGCNK